MAKKTKIILICAAALILAATIVTTLCLVLAKPSDEKPTDKTTISLSVNAYALVEDETFTIKATTNSTDVIKWTSSSPEVASVSSQGRVIAKTVGETTITATVGDASDSCKLQVVADNAQATIKLTQTTLRLSATSGTTQIQGTVVVGDNQQTLAEAGAIYEVDNASVATVSADGTVTPMSVGSTLVFVSANGRTKAVAV